MFFFLWEFFSSSLGCVTWCVFTSLTQWGRLPSWGPFMPWSADGGSLNGNWKPQGASTCPLEQPEEILLCLPLVYLFSNKLNEAIDTHGVQLFSWETSLWSRTRPGKVRIIIFVCAVVSQEAWLTKGVMIQNRKCFMDTMTDDMQHFLESFDSLLIMKFLVFYLVT